MYQLTEPAQTRWDRTFEKLGRSAPARRADEDETTYELPADNVLQTSELMRECVERNVLRTDNMERGSMRKAFPDR